MSTAEKKPSQMVLDFKVRPLLGRDDFFVASFNEEAVRLIDSFPFGFSGALVYGASGSGKTHLTHYFADVVLQKTGGETVFLRARDLSARLVADVLSRGRFFVLEDIEAGVKEEPFFHLMNGCKNAGGFLLMTARAPYTSWRLALKDLESRLSALPSVHIGLPDDDAMRYVLVKLFADRQLRVSAEVIEYILKRTERSFAAAGRIVEQADRLSLRDKKEITVALVGELFR